MTEAAPPAPVKVSAAPGCVPTYPDPVATKAQISAQLGTASTYTFWRTSAPTLRVPLNLLKAVAWQESGWQSAILACDGGIGVMQVMPSTVQQVNDRFGTTWNPHIMSGNVMVGANYLAWLIKYIGDLYYGSLYDVTTDTGLLNSVIAAYNVGPGNVDPVANVVKVGTTPYPKIADYSYVKSVRALMTSCPCSAY